jgi:probable F420-dependent oxidoreductase
MKLGKLGVFTFTDNKRPLEAQAFARRLEDWGYAALWLPEAGGRDVIAHAAWLLAGTKNLIVASGIANIYARDPLAMVCGRNTLCDQSGDRFLLGLGVSHAVMVEGMRRQAYGKPVETMRRYLEAMHSAPYHGPQLAEKPLTVLGALRPKMLALSAELADGAHPYNMTPEHTKQARGILGSGKLLCVEQKAMLVADPNKARAAARKNLAVYLTLPNYQNAWRTLGFNDNDFAQGGSDRLIDAVFVHGDIAAIKARIQAHWDAGADHVCVQAVDAEGNMGADENLLEKLAPSG